SAGGDPLLLRIKVRIVPLWRSHEGKLIAVSNKVEFGNP
ncbi:hypothetical protein EJB05_53601, partial [Eragrostis curvula]